MDEDIAESIVPEARPETRPEIRPETRPEIRPETRPEIRPETSIGLLTQEIISLMAAGEVIDSVSAVVRELIENALDAGASRIAVSLWPDQWKISVADNGTGMAAADLQRAAVAHATSKISTRPDLLNVRSFRI